MKFYVYAHLDTHRNIFYIGKGTGKRAYVKSGRSEAWKILSIKGYSVEILGYFDNNIDALLFESKMIQKYMGGLVNKTQSSFVKEMDFSDFYTRYKIDENSPTGLSYRTNSLKPNAKQEGNPAGFLNGRGYYTVTHNKKNYFVHRIVYLLHNGKISNTEIIDHIDRNRSNNNISNLRSVTFSENSINRSIAKNCPFGITNLVRNTRKDSYGKVISDYFKCKFKDSRGISKEKNFSVLKYGENTAFSLAKDFMSSNLGAKENLILNKTGYSRITTDGRRYMVLYYISLSKKYKSFSILKYGNSCALELALSFRDSTSPRGV